MSEQPDARILALRAEALAAVERLELVRLRAREAIVAQVAAGRFCRSGANEVLTEWGLPQIPAIWHVCVVMAVAYRRYHNDVEQALEDSKPIIGEALARVYGDEVRLDSIIVSEVAFDSEYPAMYGVTASVCLSTRVSAADPASARTKALDVVDGRVAELTDVTMMRGSLVIDDELEEIGPDVDPAEIALPRPGLPDLADADQATALQRFLDRVEKDLRHLNKRVRRRVIEAFDAGELDPIPNWEKTVDDFLARLGQQPLPRAYRIGVHIHAASTVEAGSHSEAHDMVWRALCDGFDEERCQRRGAHIVPTWPAVDGTWRVTWQDTLLIIIRATVTEEEAMRRAYEITGEYLAGLTDLAEAAVTFDAPFEGLDLYLDAQTD